MPHLLMSGTAQPIQQQLDTIERLAARAKVARTSEPNERYRFDYPRLSKTSNAFAKECRATCPLARSTPRSR
jgi:RAQPRD family integrative conjugative element protein